MSVGFVVIPALAVSWPMLCGAIAGASAALGYHVLQGSDQVTALDKSVEVTIDGSEVIADAMRRESQFVIARGDVKAVFSRGADGRCRVHVSGGNKSEHELTEIGRELVGRVTQHYAYNQVISEMKNQGFTVTNEEVTPDKVIRINVSKYI